MFGLTVTLEFRNRLVALRGAALRSLPGNIPPLLNPSPVTYPSTHAPGQPMMAGSSVWKTIFIPPLVAVAIYLLSVYALVPLYRRRMRYANYLPLSLPLSSTYQGSFIGRTWDRVLGTLSPFGAGNRWRRRASQTSENSLFGDEELEEGFGEHDVPVVRDRRNSGVGDDRRLSRDLEVGFRDDSDEEDEAGNDTALQRETIKNRDRGTQ